jgi:hypothetical protein
MKEAINADPVNELPYLPLFLLRHTHPIKSSDVCEVGVGVEKFRI